MILLIGVNHRVQYVSKNTDLDLVKKFIEYLENVTSANDVELIAEEFNQEALLMNDTNICVARNVSKELEVEHRFCDPDSSERAKIGIPSEKEIKKQLGLGIILNRDESAL